MKQINIDLDNIHERELHPFLVYYLARKMNIYSKTIYHEVSVKKGKGKSEWLHPDIVGFDLPVAKWDEKVLKLCKEFSLNRATIYSFEIKKTITIESLREQFFQAVSNSSWANEGYLVGVDIDTEDKELMQELNRLSRAFSIGVIKLDLIDPDNSEIVVPSRRKETLDGETMNKLFNINNDFKEFVQTVLKSININQIIHDRLDKILSINNLQNIINEAISNDDKDDEIQHPKIEDNYKKVSLDSDFTNKSPISIEIEGDKIEGDTWKELYIEVCNYFINKDRLIFLGLPNKVKGKKRDYFSKKEDNIRVAVYLKEVDLYIEVNLSANNIVSNIKKLLNEYKIDKQKVMVYLKDN